MAGKRGRKIGRSERKPAHKRYNLAHGVDKNTPKKAGKKSRGIKK